MILVTGATGYVGGRLINRLLNENRDVRVLVRNPERLNGRTWKDRVQIATGDVLDQTSLQDALVGIETAYYLVHSMLGQEDFSSADRTGAQNFGMVAHEQGVKRIIYLGGLGDRNTKLSAHLQSRQETGAMLAEYGVPVTEFRAAIIVGSGSLSFEMIRHLTERLPVMVTPRWVNNRIQPIGIKNVLDYLVAALDNQSSHGKIIEIGGKDVLTYKSMMLDYAKARSLKRFIINVPVLTPRLSSYWIHFVTPVSSTIARPLIDGLKTEVVVKDSSAHTIFPNIHPMDYKSALDRTLERLDAGIVPTSWTDALSSSQPDIQDYVTLGSSEGMIIEKRAILIDAEPTSVFSEITSLGGNKGWLYGNWLWQIRGFIDRLIGGIGLRRGRRHETTLRVGDSLDFWRVEDLQTNLSLRLKAEMKVPGKAWLQFHINALSSGQSLLSQTAFFAPRGLPGLLYWYLLYPIHKIIFRGLIGKLKANSELRLNTPDQLS